MTAGVVVDVQHKLRVLPSRSGGGACTLAVKHELSLGERGRLRVRLDTRVSTRGSMARVSVALLT